MRCCTAGWSNIIDSLQKPRTVEHLSFEPQVQVVIIEMRRVFPTVSALCQKVTPRGDLRLPQTAWLSFESAPKHDTGILQTHRFVTRRLGAVARNVTYISSFRIVTVEQQRFSCPASATTHSGAARRQLTASLSHVKMTMTA